jgi:hypothetical protein
MTIIINNPKEGLKLSLFTILVVLLSATLMTLFGQRAIGHNTGILQGNGGIARQELADTSSAIRLDFPDVGISQSTLNDSTTAIRGDFPAAGSSQTSNIYGDTILTNVEIGNLETLHPGYTYNQIKTIRQANWEAFQAICNYAIANNYRVILPGGRLEFHLVAGETIVLGDYQNINIKGSGKELSKLYFYPNVKQYHIVVFDTDAHGGNVYMKDFSIYTEKEKWETYNVTLRPSGNTNQIRIDDANVYSYRQSNIIGKTIYATTDGTTTPSPSYVVTNYDVPTKTITVSSTVTATGADDAGLIAIQFEETTHVDTVNLYGNFWLTDTIYWDFMYGIERNQPDLLSKLYYLENVDFRGFDIFIFSSGDYTTIEAKDCYFSGHEGAFDIYSNFMTDAFLKLDNVTFEECSHLIVGYIKGNYTAGNRYGSAIYSHPNTQWIWNNVTLKGNNGGASRQYTAGGAKPTPTNAITFISNSRWVDNDEYDLLNSESMPCNYVNCYFSGTLFVHNNSTFTNCTFDGALIGSYEDNSTGKFVGCTFKNETRFSIDRNNYNLELDNCIIVPSALLVTFATKTKRLKLTNCTFVDNGTAQTPGASYFEQVYPPELIIDNCRFEDSDTYGFWRFAPDVSHYTKASFSQPVIKNSTFAYGIFYANQVSSTLDADVSGNTVSFISGSPGIYRVHPREKIYRPTLSGSTINVNGNYNHYFTSGVINKIAVNSGDLEGIFYFTATDTTTFTQYANPGNTGSNVNFTQTVLPGQTIKLFFDPFNIKSNAPSSTTGDNIATGNGTTTHFEKWGFLQFGGNYVVPGSVTLRAAGVTLTDDGVGNLSGTGGSGWIDYLKNNVIVSFDTAPANAVSIELDYDYYNSIYQLGMWSKID